MGNIFESDAIFRRENKKGFGTVEWCNLIQILLIDKKFQVQVGDNSVDVVVVEGMNFSFQIKGQPVVVEVHTRYLLVKYVNLAPSIHDIKRNVFRGELKNGERGQLSLMIKPKQTRGEYRIYFANSSHSVKPSRQNT